MRLRAGPPGKGILSRRTRQTAVWGTGLLVVALVAVACGSSSATSSSKKPAKAVFDIGVIEDETGSNSTTNQPQVNGLVAWDHFVNTTGGIDGHSVHLDICDAQSSVTGAVACASRVSGDGIIVENGLTGEMAAATPILRSEGKVVFTVTPTENPPAGSNLFQASPGLATGIATILKTAKANHITNVGLVTTNNATGTFEIGAFSKTAPPLGIHFETQYLATSSVDATTQVLQLQSDHIGMLYVGSLGTAADIVLKAAKTESLSAPIVVNAGNVNNEFLASIASYMPKRIYGAPFSDFEVPSLLTGSAHDSVAAFLAKYQKVAGHAWDLRTQDLAVPITAQAAAGVLEALGTHPSLENAESYVLNHHLAGIATIMFTPGQVQDANLPIRLAEATRTSKSWSACVTANELAC